MHNWSYLASPNNYIFLMAKKPWAGTALWKRTESWASSGRETNSSMDRQVTSPAEWRRRFKKYLCAVCVIVEVRNTNN